jgi:hypothetical protein
MEWITDRLPTEEDADEDNEVVVPDPGSTPNYGYMYWWEVLGEWLPTGVFQQTRKFGEQSIRATGGRWITTRQPLASDGNKDGAVHVRKYPDKNWGANIHWSHVGTGVPWEHTNDYEGLIEPIPFEVQPILTEDGPWDDVPHHVRTFASVRRTRIDDGGWALDAVASDGTAWCRIQRRDTEVKWQRLPDLPQD